MVITPQERRVLAVIEQRASIEVPAIAKFLRITPATVRGIIQRLKNRQILLRRVSMVNCYAIGYSDYTYYFTLAPCESAQIKVFGKKLSEIPGVFWFARVGGVYQFAISVFARSLSSARAMFAEIEKLLPVSIVKRELSVRVAFEHFRRKYLASDRLPNTAVRFELKADSDRRLSSDEIELLEEIVKDSDRSLREVARVLNVAPSTINDRNSRLIRDGILLPSIYLVNPFVLGVLTSKILLRVRGVTSDFLGEFRAWCAEHPNIIHLVETMGGWDLEIGIEAELSSDIVKLYDELYHNFKGRIVEHQELPILDYLLFRPLPRFD